MRFAKFVFIALALIASPALAEEEGGGGDGEKGGPACNNAKVLERMTEDVCWECIFPIRISGQDTGGGTAAEGASDQPICYCGDSLLPGVTMGMWTPKFLFEVVQKPGCSPTLGGTELPIGSSSEVGSMDGEADIKDGYFRHVHKFIFPVAEMLELLQGCKPHGSDLALAMPTELIPTWSDDLLAFVTIPETVAFANPAGALSCIGEAATTGIGGASPIESMFWCAGSWGSMYPMVGYLAHENSRPEDTGLLSARLLAYMHRLGQAWKTVGNECGPEVHPMITKNQYKMQQYWPVPESSDNHFIGESDMTWGSYRNDMNDDYLKLVWRWDDCCLEGM